MLLFPSIRQVFTGHAAPVYCLSYRKGSSVFYSGGGDGIVAKWDLTTGAFIQAVASVPAPVYALKAMPENNALLAGLSNGDLYIFDETERRVTEQHSISDRGVFDLALADNGHRLITATGHGTVQLFDTSNWKLVQSIDLGGSAIRCLDVSPCGTKVIAGSSDGHLYHLEFDGELSVGKALKAHSPSVFTVRYLSDHVILTGGRDAMLRKWTTEENNDWSLATELPAHQFTVNRVAESPDGTWLATASRDKTIRIWQLETLELHKVLSSQRYEGAHDFSVNTLQWVNNTMLLTAGDDKRMICWEFSSRRA